MSIYWLVKKLGINKEALVSEGEEGFRSRLRLQKAAYLLKRMGVEPFKSYEFNIYLRGPYSPELAKTYYGELKDYSEPDISDDKFDVFKWYMEHDDKWLEIASSILLILERYPDMGEKELLSLLKSSKPWVTEVEFREIYGELEGKGLVGKKQILLR